MNINYRPVVSPRKLKCVQVLIIVLLIVVFVRNMMRAESFVRNVLLSESGGNPTEYSGSLIIMFLMAGILVIWFNFALLVLWTFRKLSEGPVLVLGCLQLILVLLKCGFIMSYYIPTFGIAITLLLISADVIFFVLLIYYSFMLCTINEEREGANEVTLNAV